MYIILYIGLFYCSFFHALKARRASSSLSISSSRERFSSRKNLPRIESITDLTNFDLTQNPEDLDKEQ